MDAKHESRNKNILIGALIAVVLIMGVGYAAFAQQLTINGSAEITSTWDVHIASIEVATDDAHKATGTATSVSATKDSATSATFSANLQAPGDSITYKVVVENSGTLAAKLDDNGVTTVLQDKTGTNVAIDAADQAIKYSYEGITAGSKVAAATGDTPGTLTFYVKVEYDNAITSQPAEAQLVKTLAMTLNFVQDK